MQRLDAQRRRAQLLDAQLPNAQLRNARPWLAAILALCCSAPSDRQEPAQESPTRETTTSAPSDREFPRLPNDASSRSEGRRRALHYLENTDDEIGADVLIATLLYGRREPRAIEVARARADSLRDQDSVLFQRLVAAIHESHPRVRGVSPPFPTLEIDGEGTPRPADDLDDRVASCPLEAFDCSFSQECSEFFALPNRGGYVLTHQAVTLVFARWGDCTLPNATERRHEIAARMVSESDAATDVDDLFLERLAMLTELGVDISRWRTQLYDAQHNEGCWPASDDVPCHPHPTGLALWALSVPPSMN